MVKSEYGLLAAPFDLAQGMHSRQEPVGLPSLWLPQQRLVPVLPLSDPDGMVQPELPGPEGPEPERHRVRVLLYGAPVAVRHTIMELHKLRYVDQFRWTPVRAVPENGIFISQAEAQSYAFLLRELLIE